MIKPSASFSSQTILIVDDNPNILQLLFNYLKKAGYKVLIAKDGKKALNTAEKIKPDLILLDIMMPIMDGFTTCNGLKNNPRTKDIPVIFMTALSQIDEKVRGFSLGAVDYITKPIEEQELLARIKNHLAIQSLNQRLVKYAARQKLLSQISDRIRQSLNLNIILETTAKEIRAFLNCDFVGLLRLDKRSISIDAYDSADNIAISSASTISYEDLCPYPEGYESYLLGDILVFENEKTSSEQYPARKGRGTVHFVNIKHD